MLLLEETSVDDITMSDSSSLSYHELESTENWEIFPIQDIVEAKAENLDIPGFSREELDEFLLYLCTQ